jgi:diaminohydroxyphosphoribosylaminopyrimidine deaminase/5-amino-6-(5-phosphoribosylamino)uracil reductase
MNSIPEEAFMRRCFDLAGKGLGHVSPNPLVGAVIVHKGKIIGEGYHRQYGGPHAEVNAVSSVKNQSLLRESVLYVNLEPCSHYGKTPPCADLIIEKGIPQVIIANNDPFPEVSGRGIRRMRESGINVIENFLKKEGAWLNRRFFMFHTRKRPYIFLKWAQTSDGFIDCTRKDERQLPLRISSPESSMFSHKLRAEEDAILVGTHTALQDNPDLTVRNWYGKNPVRILIDKNLQVPFSHNIYNGKSPTLVFTSKLPVDIFFENVEFIISDFTDNQTLPLDFLTNELYKRNIQSLIVEGGYLLHTSFIADNLWDEVRKETNTSLTVGCGIPAPVFSGKKIKHRCLGKNIVEEFKMYTNQMKRS